MMSSLPWQIEASASQRICMVRGAGKDSTHGPWIAGNESPVGHDKTAIDVAALPFSSSADIGLAIRDPTAAIRDDA